MKNKLLLYISLHLIFLPIISLFAQQKDSLQFDNITKRLQVELGLSKEQAVKVQALNYKKLDQYSEVSETEKDNKKAKKRKYKEINRAYDKEMRSLLTPQQWKAFQKIRPEKFATRLYGKKSTKNKNKKRKR